MALVLSSAVKKKKRKRADIPSLLVLVRCDYLKGRAIHTGTFRCRAAGGAWTKDAKCENKKQKNIPLH